MCVKRMAKAAAMLAVALGCAAVAPAAGEVGGGTWLMFLKLKPATMGEWTQYNHGPDRNPVSHDKVDPKDGFLWAFKSDNGQRVKELKLVSPPVFDGMAVAQGRVFISTQDGRLSCYGKIAN